MAIGTPVNLGNNGGTADPTVITTGATVAVGNTILVTISQETASSVTSVTDSAGNSYAQDVASTAANHKTYVYRATVTTQLNSGQSITIAKSIASNVGVSAVSVSGLAASPFDASGTANGNSATPSAAATTTNNDDLVVGACGYEVFTLTQPGGAWNNLTGNTTASNAKIAWAYRIESSTGTFTYNPTLNIGEKWAALVIGYKGAPPPVPDTLWAQSSM